MEEFEEKVGRLSRARLILDLPPYATLLLQPSDELAFRHPEYKLSEKLELLYELYWDAEGLLQAVNWGDAPVWAPSANEN